ncbi:hypothetical protein EVAR_31609_1 [Eumeta japonica]|uniref:Uncharacterized protein n=1 Tax=Eumeta variegata TaxID=151549 RepID=A0A4C1W280_EUMVA|nr:hypothetical protein EVAR_31609_1 [Eumeta japonica]
MWRRVAMRKRLCDSLPLGSMVLFTTVYILAIYIPDSGWNPCLAVHFHTNRGQACMIRPPERLSRPLADTCRSASPAAGAVTPRSRFYDEPV